MDISKAKRLYNMQKSGARIRRIDWNLSFEEWLGWWIVQLGIDWMAKRGCRKGQYVMARFGDNGPYALWNIECITCEENHYDQGINGKNRSSKIKLRERGVMKVLKVRTKGRKLTASQVIAIYYALGQQKIIADKYGISPRMVWFIKHRKIWKSVLTSSTP